MRRLVWFLAAVALAQEQAVFTGRVLTQDGTPVTAAKVIAERFTNNQTIASSQIERVSIETDAAGRFRQTLAAGAYEPSISADGFAPLYPPPLTLAAGQTVEREYRLLREPVLSGRVTGPEGEPVPSPNITLYAATFYRGERRLQALGSKVTTTERGEFRIVGIAPGRYYVSASAPGTQTTLYPDALSLETAVAVTATGGTETGGIAIKLRREPLFTVRGKVVDAGGNPISEIVVSLEGGTAGLSARRLNAVSKADGSFEIAGLLPGTYRAFTIPLATGEKFDLPKLDGRLQFYIGKEDLTDVEFRLLPRPQVTGTIRMEDGSPVRGTTPMEMELLDLLGSPVIAQARIAPDGTFDMVGLAASRYQFAFNNVPPGHYVKSIRFGGQEFADQPIDFSTGAGGQLDIAISAKAAQVTGVVRNAKNEALPGVWVYYWRGTAQARTVRTDQNGAFRIESLRPGEYRFGAFEEVDFGVLQNPQFRAAFADETKEVNATESGQKHVELQIIESDRIAREAAKYP